MDKQNNKSIDQSHLSTGKKSLFIGGVIVLIIAITPILFYSYEGFSNDSKIWKTFLFDFETGYPSMYHFAWYIVGKAVPLLLLFIWFFTCKHWWHWILLIPIAMYAFQLWGVFNQNFSMDELEIYYVLPLMMVLVPIVYLIRAKLFNKIRGNDLAAFEEELMRKRTFLEQIKDLFQ